MLKLNYYFIDVGENSCTILQKNFLFSIKDVICERDMPRAELIKEVISRNFKSKSPLFSQQDFKIVFVNKFGKRRVKTEIVDLKTNRHIDPTMTCKKYDIFIIEPNQRLDIECQVMKNEVEIRALRYETIVHKANW